MSNYNNKSQKRHKYTRKNTNNSTHRTPTKHGYDKLKEKIFTDNAPSRRATKPFPDFHHNQTAKVVAAFAAETPPKCKAQRRVRRMKSPNDNDFNPNDYDRTSGHFAPFASQKPFISNYKYFEDTRQSTRHRPVSSPHVHHMSPATHAHHTPTYNAHNTHAMHVRSPPPNINNVPFYDAPPRAPAPKPREPKPLLSYRPQTAELYLNQQQRQTQKQLETQQMFDELTKTNCSDAAKAEILLKLTIEQAVKKKDEKQKLLMEKEMERRNKEMERRNKLKLEKLLNAQVMTQSTLRQIVQSLEFHTMQYKQAEITGNATSMKVLLIQLQQDKQLYKQGETKLNSIMQQIARIEHGEDVSDEVIDQYYNTSAGNQYNVRNSLMNSDEVGYGHNAQQQQVNHMRNSDYWQRMQLPQRQQKPKINLEINMTGRLPRYY